MSTAAEIREFLVEQFLFGEGGDDLSDEDSLLEKGIVNSTGVLEVVGFLEDNYGIRVADDELLPQNLDSISKLTAFLHRKGGASAPQ